MTTAHARRRPSTSSVTSKGQVTIPAHIRNLLGVGPHDVVEFLVKDGKVEIIPAGSIVERTRGSMKTGMPHLTPQQENDVFEEAMAEEAMKLRR